MLIDVKEVTGSDIEFRSLVRQKLELPRAVLFQIKETHLCNEFIDEAIEDIEKILNALC